MSIISSLKRVVRNVIGDRKVTIGTYGDASGGAELNTNLEVCEFIVFTGTASTAGSAVPTVTTDLPAVGSAVPIISPTTRGGLWWAYGR